MAIYEWAQRPQERSSLQILVSKNMISIFNPNTSLLNRLCSLDDGRQTAEVGDQTRWFKVSELTKCLLSQWDSKRLLGALLSPRLVNNVQPIGV